MTKLPRSASALAGYLRPLIEKTDPASLVGRAISDWCWDNEAIFGVQLELFLGTRSKRGVRRRKRAYGKPLPKTAWARLGNLVKACTEQPVKTPILHNANMVSDLVELDDVDREIFAFTALTSGERAFDRLVSKLIQTRVLETVDVVSVMTGIDATQVEERIKNGLLRRLQFIDGAEERPGQYDLFVPYRVMDAVRSSCGDRQSMERALLGAPARSNLDWRDFEHIARERNFAMQLLTGAVQRGESGVNVLLYGAPGVGKTELAKILAQRAGCELFTIAETDEDGEEADREERLSALQVADRLARRRGKAVLLFDEMEDILSGGDVSWKQNRRIRQSGSKAHLNRLLETNETPLIWTTNNIHEFDPAFLRRMIFAIEMKTPPASVRAVQWRRLAESSGIQISRKKSTELARAHAVPPSFSKSALHAVKIAKGGSEDIEFALSAVTRPSAAGSKKQARPSARDFDLAIANPSCDLNAIEKRLRTKTCLRDVSFCIYGPPGTGKSALAVYLAECMELDVLEKRGSDLLSPWVGETEQRIAETFEEAAADQKLLIIDEAETLFWGRDGATKSWEVSMVNEFLIGLERSPVPIACTTNHLDRVDAAALRRFTFKTKLDYLTSNQVAAAFKYFFEGDAPTSLSRCRTLTPGDFAAVKKQLRFQEEDECDPDKIAKMLEAEANVKQRGVSGIGF